MKAVGKVLEGFRFEVRCPYCGEGREYKGHVIPRDDCCLPHALDTVTWITAYLEKGRGGPQERAELRQHAQRLSELLINEEASAEGALHYAVSVIKEKKPPLAAMAEAIARALKRRAEERR